MISPPFKNVECNIVCKNKPLCDALKLTLHLIDIFNSYFGFFPTLIYQYFVLTQQTHLMMVDSMQFNFIQVSRLYQV